MRKRILSLALCFALALSLLPTGALAAETSEWIGVEGIVGGKIKFDASTGTIVECEESVTSADIPSSINGVSVTSIGDYAFAYCRSLSSVSIPDSVTSIGDGAFAYCSSLSGVSIPSSVTSIGDYVFSYCESLESIFVAPTNSSYCSNEDGVLFNKSKTELMQYPVGNTRTSYSIPDSVTSIGDSAFAYCSSLTSVTIPDSVTSIGDGAFEGCTSLSSVSIPGSVTNIGSCAFYGCSSLSRVTIPDGVTNIGESAFLGCSSLTSVTIPDSVTSIGIGAFYGCSGLTSVSIPNNVKSIETYTFFDCRSLTNVTIPDSVTSMGNCVFYGCSSLTSVSIPSSVTSMGIGVFHGCKSLNIVIIPDSVTSINAEVFCNCSSLTSVTIPDSVTSIGEGAFAGCSGLTSVTIPNNVEHIGHYSFADCSSLSSVSIPGSVTSIGRGAFFGCTSLENIFVDSTNSCYYSDGGGVLFNKSKTQVIQYPVGNARTSYRIPDGVTSIGDDAFSGCSRLSSVSIPDSVTSIGRGVFFGCTSLENIFVDSTNSCYCSDGGGVLFNKSKTQVIQYPVGNARTSYRIPDGVTSIGDDAFSGCGSLTSVSIPGSVTSIFNRAFYRCDSLTDVYYAGTEEEWNKISIWGANEVLTKATIHYNAGQDSSLNGSNSQLYLVDCAPKNLCVDKEQAAVLSFQFNRNVKAGVGKVKLWNGDTGAFVTSVPVDDMRVSIQLNKVQVKLNPGVLEDDTTYFVTIDNGSFVSDGLRFHGVTGEKTWTFATNPSTFSGSFPLKYAKKPGIFGTKDMSKPPIPDGNDDDYAAALAAWAKDLGVADITQKTAKAQLGKKVYLPVKQQNAANNADPILLWDKGTTVRQVMSDLIFIENLQPYIAEMDRDLQEIERITNNRAVIPGLTLRAEAKVCEKAISWYGQINSYLKGRNQNSNFMLSVAAPFATELLANLSKSTEGDYYSFIKPFVKAELNHQANKASLSALENADTYEEYTKAADDFGLVLDATNLYKATVEDGYPGVKGVVSFGADLLSDTFSKSDNETLEEISDAYETFKSTKNAVNLSMTMGSSIGLFPLVVDLHNDLWRGVESQAKALYFIGDYYISEKYPALYQSVYSDGTYFPTKQPLMPGVSYGEYQYIVEAYQQNPSDAVLFNWTLAFSGNLETSQRDKLLHLRKELTNYAVLLNYIKSIDVEQAKANLVKYVSADMHQGKTTTNYVSCPVRIDVYDKNHTDLLASLSTEDTEIQTVDYGSLYLLGEDNQTKCFIYHSGEYSVEIVPYEEGTMDMMVLDRDENGTVSGKYFQAVDLKKGDVFTREEEGLHKLFAGEETVIPGTEQVPIARVNLSGPDRLAIGEAAQLEAQVLPVIAGEQEVSWSSSDPAVLSVDESGKMTAHKTGTATITASTESNVTAEQTVEVYVPVTALSVSKESVTMLKGETITPELSGSEGADLSRVHWSSGNPSVVGVSRDGTIEGLSPGKALITGTVDDVEVSYSVQVYEDLLDVTIYQSDMDGDRIKLELNNYSSGTPFSGVVYTAVYEPNGRLHCIFTDELTVEAGDSKICYYPINDLQTEQQFTVKTIVTDKNIKPLQLLKSEILIGGK